MDFNAKPSCKGDSRSLSCNLRAYFQNLELLTSEESRSSCPDKQVFAENKSFSFCLINSVELAHQHYKFLLIFG